jgi:hypothetical protein
MSFFVALLWQPTPYSHGSPEEAVLTVKNMWPCWKAVLTAKQRAHLNELAETSIPGEE